MLPQYENDMNILKQRILDLIPSNSDILKMETPFDMLSIKEFKFTDIGPSSMMIAVALRNAIYEYEKTSISSGRTKRDQNNMGQSLQS